MSEAGRHQFVNDAVVRLVLELFGEPRHNFLVGFLGRVSERTRPVSRGGLAPVLWPEEQAASWEAAISSLASRMSALLSPYVLASRGMSFYRGLGHYQIRLPAGVWVGTEAGVSALNRAEAALRSNDAGQALWPATVAASIALGRSCRKYRDSGSTATGESCNASCYGHWTAWGRCSWSNRRPDRPWRRRWRQ